MDEIQKLPRGILNLLEEEGIMYVTRPGPGEFVFTEACDHYFSVSLTRDQVLLLADELRALAGETEP